MRKTHPPELPGNPQKSVTPDSPENPMPYAFVFGMAGKVAIDGAGTAKPRCPE